MLLTVGPEHLHRRHLCIRDQDANHVQAGMLQVGAELIQIKINPFMNIARNRFFLKSFREDYCFFFNRKSILKGYILQS